MNLRKRVVLCKNQTSQEMKDQNLLILRLPADPVWAQSLRIVELTKQWLKRAQVYLKRSQTPKARLIVISQLPDGKDSCTGVASCHGDVYHWQPGDYTLASDSDPAWSRGMCPGRHLVFLLWKYMHMYSNCCLDIKLLLLFLFSCRLVTRLWGYDIIYCQRQRWRGLWSKLIATGEVSPNNIILSFQLLSVCPSPNALSLVYCDHDSLCFSK